MAVFRVERNTGYTVMSNHHLRNKELSLKAKGLLSQMLSLPEDWDYTLAGLSHINREKIDAIREAVKELEKAGYIVRSRERDEKGRLRGADYVIYEQPQPREPEAATSGGQPPILDLPTLENPTLDNPTLEKPTQEKPTLETDTWTDEDGNTHSDTYRVYYDYYICTVTLENFNLSHLPIYIMGEETLSRYALYMATLGNRPDLLPSSPYVGKYTNKPPAHEIPEDYLADEAFAAILKEAEKYVGYPYVWGGSSPSTSFDCSGFVSYVYNQCGWSFGRLGAQGLYNICSRTSSPRPGDLVFFVGTYDTAGVSHVGIYVGDGWMLHCGDPISYANLNSSYWQSHLYAYGRLP